MEEPHPPVLSFAPSAGEGPGPQPLVAALATTAKVDEPPFLFFPSNGASRVEKTATEGDSPAAAVPASIDWASYLAVNAHEERLRAWDRVATVPVSRRFSARHTIMRRTQICSRVRMRVVSPVSFRSDLAATVNEPEHPPRRRKFAHDGHQDGPGFSGEPLGAGAVEELWSTAEGAVLDRYLKHPSLNLLRDVREARQGRLRQCSGVKRWREDEDGKRTNLGSFSLRLYTRLTPLLADAWKKLGLLTEAAANAMVVDQKAGNGPRDPRRHLAREGIPELSTIGDVTEPDISREDIIPLTSTVQITSPLKRKGRLDAHVDVAQDRLRQKMVKLCPGSSAADGISPVKPSSPSTPSEKPSPAGTHGIASTGRALGGSLFPLGEPITSSPVYSPTKTFRGLSCSPPTLNSTLDNLESKHIPREVETPLRRPGTLAPSKWTRSDITTLSRKLEIPVTPGSNITSADSAKLMNSIPESIGTPVDTPSHWERYPQSFEFDSQLGTGFPQRNDGCVSFNSTAHYTPTSGHGQSRRLVERKRRKSEPLTQKHFMRMEQSRRQSMGPSKLRDLTEEETPMIDASPKHDKLNSDGTVKSRTPVLRKTVLTTGCVISEVTDTKTDATVQLPSFFTDRAHHSKGLNLTTPYRDRSTYDIDVRHNLDIFGARTPTKAPLGSASKASETATNNATVQRLASMVEDRCEGLAKVSTVEENGRFVVRFKLPMKYAATFPESQGADDSCFTSTPSAISSSPRIRFDTVSIALPSGDGESLTSLPTLAQPSPNSCAESAIATGFPLVMDDAVSQTHNNHLVTDELATHRPLQSSPTRATPCTPSFLPVLSDADQTLVVDDFNTTANETVRTPGAPAHAAVSNFPTTYSPSQLRTPSSQQKNAGDEDVDAPSSELISDLSFEPTFQTPTHGQFAFSPSEQLKALAAASPMQAAKSKDDSQTFTMTKARASPPLNTSFTPVNKPAAQSREATPTSLVNLSERAQSVPPNITSSDSQNVNVEEFMTVRDHQQRQDDETREYLSAFLKRSTKPKRASTTDAGSPIAHSPVRQPLGTKSPNRVSESPEKTKRKRESEEVENSPIKPDTTAKKARIGPKAGRPRGPSQTASKPPSQKASKVVQKTAEKNEGDTDDIGPVVRRSSRLNTKESKTALPTAIKLNRTGVTKDSWPMLNSAVRNEQAELTRQTNSNTRKNRGRAETVQQILTRVSSEEASGEDIDESNKESKALKRGKTVAWKDPIESHHAPKATRGRPPKQMTLRQPITHSPTVAEEKKTTKPTPKSRIAKPSASSLGRTNNGTPAKRVTRSRTACSRT